MNVRDLGNVKHAFKFLAFPDTRIFQCSSGTHKVSNVIEIFHNKFYFVILQRDWMEAFDGAKKSNQKQSQPNQRESVSERPVSMISRGDSTESNNRIKFLEIIGV